jgi:hypothetical protein
MLHIIVKAGHQRLHMLATSTSAAIAQAMAIYPNERAFSARVAA